MLPLVTIGVPVFNGEKYLVQTLTSLLNQTYQNIEVLVSDNCSTDGTELICLDFESRDSRLKFIRQPSNQGWIANYEYLVANAHGEFFCWCGADDTREPEFVSTLVNCLLSETGVVCAMSDVCDIDENGSQIGCQSLELIRLNHSKPPSELQEIFFRNPCKGVYHCIYGLFRTEIVRDLKINYMNFLYGAAGWEIGFLAQVALRGRIVSVSGFSMQYRRHRDSMYNAEVSSSGFVDFVKNYLSHTNILLAILEGANLPLLQKLRIRCLLFIDGLRYLPARLVNKILRRDS